MDKELKYRVFAFNTLSLPDQPMFMHMGTSYLVSDLESALLNVEAERDRLRAKCEELESLNDIDLAAKDDLIEKLRADRDAFCSDYRMKCDEETKALHVEIERLRAEIVTLRNAAVNADERTDMLRGKLATAVLAHIDATAESDLLRAEVAALNQPVKLSEWQELVAERDRLRARIDAVREIYAGMEGFIAQTAPEGYLQRIVKQMYDAALGGEGK